MGWGWREGAVRRKSVRQAPDWRDSRDPEVLALIDEGESFARKAERFGQAALAKEQAGHDRYILDCQLRTYIAEIRTLEIERERKAIESRLEPSRAAARAADLSSPITPYDECVAWNPTFSDHTVADRKRMFQRAQQARSVQRAVVLDGDVSGTLNDERPATLASDRPSGTT
jgi:hypothetical protein